MDPISAVVWPYFISLFVGIILFAILGEKRRVARLESTARRLGFEFSALGRDSTITEHERFELFHKGGSRKVSKEMWRSTNGNKFRLFTYSYREYGSSNRTRHQTVLSVQCMRLDAPALHLHPKLKRLMLMPDFGQYDPGISISPVLSKNYVVKGADEVSIRAFFKPAVIEFFEGKSGFHLEANGDTLILFNSGQRTGYYEVEKLYAEGQELLSKVIY